MNTVTITIQRESEELIEWVYPHKGSGKRFVTGYRPHYSLSRTKNRSKRMDDIGKYLWESLGLPDEDGEHELIVGVLAESTQGTPEIIGTELAKRMVRGDWSLW